MKALHFAVSTVAIAASAFAQTTYQVVPAGNDTTEGSYYSSRFGVYGAMRMQWAEGELGNNVAVLRGIGFRLDRNVSSWTHYGRKHSDLKIYCSKGNHATMSATYASNILSTPTMVYSGSNAMPAFPHNPTGPHAWTNSLNIPFGTTYIHFGTSDLLIDSQMSGGTLDNSVTWASNSYRGYFLDSVTTSTVGSAGDRVYYGNGSLTGGVNQTNRIGCKDSKTTVSYGPYVYTYIYRYSPLYSNTTYRNKVRAYNYGYYYPPNTTVATAMGFPNTTGATFPGVTCNKVYVNLALVPLIRFVKTPTTTSSYTYMRDYFLGSSSALIPYNPVYQNIVLMTQSAFLDSTNGSMRLSQATKTTFPKPPLVLKRNSVYSAGSATATSGYKSNTSYYFPVIRYTK